MIKTLTIACLAFVPTLSLAQGDAMAGERAGWVFSGCDAAGESTATRSGSACGALFELVIAPAPGNTYSDVLAGSGRQGDTWAAQGQDAFFARPQDEANGTNMLPSGLRKKGDRQDVLAYLATSQAGGS